MDENDAMIDRRLLDARRMDESIRRSAADVLDALALGQLLAYLQSALYSRAISTAGFVPAADLTVISTIDAHENAHVAALRTLIVARNGPVVGPPAFDFTAKGALPDFAFAAAQYETFRMLAQALEDLSVRAYKGQVQALMTDKVALNAALAIHAVEARHAAEIRRLRGKKAWIAGSSLGDLPAFLQPIYTGEENTTQGTVDATTVAAGFGGADAATEAFDEPLTQAQVTTIVTPFLA